MIDRGIIFSFGRVDLAAAPPDSLGYPLAGHTRVEREHQQRGNVNPRCTQTYPPSPPK